MILSERPCPSLAFNQLCITTLANLAQQSSPPQTYFSRDRVGETSVEGVRSVALLGNLALRR